MKKLDKDICAVIEGLAGGLKGKAGALLSVLHAVREQFGYIPPYTIPAIANILNLSQAEVYGVVTFYKDFRLSPPAKHVIRICHAESCMAMGAREITDYLKTRLGIDPGRSTDDNMVSLEAVYCFGNCACSPSVMIDGKLYGKIDIEKLEALLDGLIKD